MICLLRQLMIDEGVTLKRIQPSSAQGGPRPSNPQTIVVHIDCSGGGGCTSGQQRTKNKQEGKQFWGQKVNPIGFRLGN